MSFISFRIKQTKRRKQKPKARIKQWIPHQDKKRKNLKFDLLYYERSPNYCEKITNLDVPGTYGRQCNRTSLSSDSCSTLCCGRGYNLQRRKRVERCNCKFVWCCTVECQNCIIEEWVTICN